MKPDKPPKANPSERQDQSSPLPVSDGVLALFLIALAAALVLGYLFLDKMADISRQDDCILAHRKNCAAIEWPSRNQAA
jgi:hypothetical protein